MNETIIAALIGVAGTVIAGIAGALLGAKITSNAGTKILIRQAKGEFAAAFTEVLVRLHTEVPTGRDISAIDVLKAGYPSHFAAYIKLRSVLPANERATLDVAWHQYTKDDEDQLSEERAFYRFCYVLEPDEPEHQNMLAIKHINILLAAVELKR